MFCGTTLRPEGQSRVAWHDFMPGYSQRSLRDKEVTRYTGRKIRMPANLLVSLCSLSHCAVYEQSGQMLRSLVERGIRFFQTLKIVTF